MANERSDKYSKLDIFFVGWFAFWILALQPGFWICVLFFMFAMIHVANIQRTYLLRKAKRDLLVAQQKAKEDECSQD